MLTLDAIRSNYDHKPIAALESLGQLYHSDAQNAQQGLTKLLWYLEMTCRYKENQAYAKSNFKTYLVEHWGFAWASYLGWKRAWVLYPELSAQHGQGLAAEVARRCTNGRFDVVMNEIAALGKATRVQVEAVIAKYAAEQAGKTTTRTQSLAKENAQLKQEVARLQQENAQLRGEVKALQEQSEDAQTVLQMVREAVAA